MSASYRSNPNAPKANPSASAGQTATETEKQIPVDGFKQVLDLLRAADPAFRESLLRRLAARDRDLARSLRADLGM